MSQLAIKINFKSLMKFTIPSMLLMIFLSFYVMVDGMFVAQFVGTGALSAINIVYPTISVMMGLGVMFGTGGGAICAIKLGEGKEQEAREDFTSIVIAALTISLVTMALCIYFIKDIIYFLGSTEEIYQHCYEYLLILLIFAPALMMQMVMQYLLITSGRPNRAVILTVIAGMTNIILDYIFIVPFGWGIAGAALATGFGELFGAFYGFYCFTKLDDIALKFVKPKIRFKMLFASAINGSSEMVSNTAMAITTYLFNRATMMLAGPDGVAAITIILYSQFLLVAILLGYSGGVAPLISYNFGQRNRSNLKRIFRLSIIFIVTSTSTLFVLAQLLAPNLVSVFAEEGSNVHNLATGGLRIFAFAFLFAGINIFGSGLFTAFSNGKISALISFLRTFVFISTALILLPPLIGIVGVWIAVPLAEFLTILLVVALLMRYKKVYRY